VWESESEVWVGGVDVECADVQRAITTRSDSLVALKRSGRLLGSALGRQS